MSDSNLNSASTASPTLLRALGPMMATAIIVGNVIGSGIFVKPHAVAKEVPNFGCVALVWILGGVLALLGCLALAEVSVLFPKSGGNYVFLREALGRMFGFLWGWVEFWIIRTGSIAALATMVTQSLHNTLRIAYDLPADQGMISYWEERFITVGIIIGLALVNVRGVTWGGMLQLVVSIVKMGSLLAIIALPFIVRGPIEAPLAESQATSGVAFTWAGLATAMLGVQWAYHGWMNVTAVAEEVIKPQRNIPLSMLVGIGIVIALYLGANAVYHWVITLPEMRALSHTSVAAEYCLRLVGPIGAALASSAVMISTFGALNGNILVGPRLLYAMGQDKLVPQRLAAVHPRYQTPAWAIMVMAVWSCLLVLGGAAIARFQLPVVPLWDDRELNLNLPPGKQLFDVLTDFAMFGAVIFETLAVATIFVFRARMPNADRPYRCPGYPLVPIIYVLVLIAVAIGTVMTQRTEAAVGLGFMALGVVVYLVLFWKRS